MSKNNNAFKHTVQVRFAFEKKKYWKKEGI